MIVIGKLLSVAEWDSFLCSPLDSFTILNLKYGLRQHIVDADTVLLFSAF